MTAPYRRTSAQSFGDLSAAREFEGEVAKHLPAWTHIRTESSTELDFMIPGCYLEVKEKRQPLTVRWHLLPDVDEVNLMVVDELSIRKALLHAPYAYFLLRDVPQGRMFLASAVELAVADRVRRNRVGKGKWIVDLTQFRILPKLKDVMGMITTDIQAMKWKDSGCLSLEPVPQV